MCWYQRLGCWYADVCWCTSINGTSGYDEVSRYDWDNEAVNWDNFSGASAIGHFTQVVWDDSVELGIGVGIGSQWLYVVARYSPPGNIYMMPVESMSVHVNDLCGANCAGLSCDN